MNGCAIDDMRDLNLGLEWTSDLKFRNKYLGTSPYHPLPSITQPKFGVTWFEGIKLRMLTLLYSSRNDSHDLWFTIATHVEWP